MAKYSNWSMLPDSSIKCVVDKFERTGSIQDDKRSGSVAAMPEKKEEIKKRLTSSMLAVEWHNKLVKYTFLSIFEVPL